jgi:hypothetical protein
LNPNNCKITGIHIPIEVNNKGVISLQCRYCHHSVCPDGNLLPKKPFNREQVFLKIVKYYIDKKGYSKEQANEIAQKEIERQMNQ